MSIDTGVFKQWVGQVRECPPHLSPKGRVIIPAREFVCTGVAIRLIVTAGPDPTPSVESVRVEMRKSGRVDEVLVPAGQWLTWPILEQS